MNYFTTVSYFGRSLWSLKVVFLGGLDLNEQAGGEKKKSKTDRDSVVHDHSFTQIFVRRTMMALESVLLWCLTVFLFFFHLAF